MENIFPVPAQTQQLNADAARHRKAQALYLCRSKKAKVLVACHRRVHFPYHAKVHYVHRIRAKTVPDTPLH